MFHQAIKMNIQMKLNIQVIRKNYAN